MTVRWNFQVNAASIALAALACVFAAAWLHSTIDARAARELASSAGREADRLRDVVEAGDLARNRAEAEVATARGLADSYATELAGLSRDLDTRTAEVARASRLAATWRQRYDAVTATQTAAVEEGVTAYRFALPWLTLADPDIAAPGNEIVETDLRINLQIVGFVLAGGLLQTEVADLSLTDPAGAVVARPPLASYRFQYTPPPEPREPWYSHVHLDLVGGLSTPYPWSFERTQANVGLLASIYGATLGLWGNLMIDGPEARLFAGYAWRAF